MGAAAGADGRAGAGRGDHRECADDALPRSALPGELWGPVGDVCDAGDLPDFGRA